MTGITSSKDLEEEENTIWDAIQLKMARYKSHSLYYSFVKGPPPRATSHGAKRVITQQIRIINLKRLNYEIEFSTHWPLGGDLKVKELCQPTLFIKRSFWLCPNIMSYLVRRKASIFYRALRVFMLPTKYEHYSMVPDCAHGRNKNIKGNFVKTTAWIKTSGVRK